MKQEFLVMVRVSVVESDRQVDIMDIKKIVQDALATEPEDAPIKTQERVAEIYEIK